MSEFRQRMRADQEAVKAKSLLIRVIAMIPVGTFGFVVLESEGRLRVPGALRFLGDASYSVFLTHYPILILLAKLAKLLAWREAIPPILQHLDAARTVPQAARE